MGTTAIWQSTDQTAAHGRHTGNGSRRRVREFRVSSDTFATLRQGEAIVHTNLGPAPVKVAITAVELPHDRPTPRLIDDAKSECEIDVHPANELPAATEEPRAATQPVESGTAPDATSTSRESPSRDPAASSKMWAPQPTSTDGPQAERG